MGSGNAMLEGEQKAKVQLIKVIGMTEVYQVRVLAFLVLRRVPIR